MKSSDLLISVRELFQEDGNICFFSVAKDSKNYPVNPSSSDACKWCSLGAIEKFAEEIEIRDMKNFQPEDFLHFAIGFPKFITVWHDNSSPDEIRAKLDLAIELAILSGQ